MDNLPSSATARTADAEQALRDSEARLSGVIASAMDAIITIDAGQRIVLFNVAAEQMLRCSAAAAIGQPLDRFIPERYRAVHREHIQRFGETGATSRSLHALMPLSAMRADGEEFPIEASISQVTIGGQKLLTVILRDITERKRAEQALRWQAEELAALQATVLEMTTRHNLPDLLQTIVERAVRLLDADGGGLYLCDPERQEARCVVSYNTPRDYAGTVLKYGEGAAGRVARSGEALIIDDYRTWPGRATTFESEQPFRAVVTVPMLWQGQVTGVIHVLRFIENRPFTQVDLELLTLFANHAAIATENARLLQGLQLELAERKRAEQKLSESEQRYRSTLDNMREGCQLIDFEWRYAYINKAAAEQGRSTPEELLHRTMMAMYPGIQHTPLFGVLRRCMEERAPAQMENEFSFPNGTTGWFELRVQPVPEGIFILSSDITARKQAEAQIREHAARLQVLADASRAFAEASLDYQAVLDRVAHQIAEALGDNCTIRLLSDDGEWLNVAAIYDTDPEALEFTRTILAANPLRADEPHPTLRVLHSGQPLLMPIVDREQMRASVKPEYWPVLDRVGIHSLIVAPMHIRGQVIGVLSIVRHRRARPAFDEHDLNLAQDLADRAALAITNARLYQDLQAELERRERAEDALADERNLLRTLIDQIPDYVYVKDAESRFLIANSSVARHMGAASPDELSGKTDRDFYPPERAAQFYADEQAIIQSGQALINHDEPNVDAAGNLKWILTTKLPMRDGGGKIVGLVGVGHDITARKQAEEALRQNEERYRIIFGLTKDYAYEDTIEADGRIVPEWITAGVTRITGYTFEETKAPDFWLRLVHPDDIPILIQHTQRILSGQSDTAQTRIMTKTGEVRWLENHAYPIWDAAQGRVVRFYGAALDITERKQAEEAWQESQQLFYKIFHSSPTAIVLSRLSDGRFVEANENFLKLTGYTLDEVIGLTSTEAGITADPQAREERLAALKQDGLLPSFEVEVIRKSGEIRNGLASVGTVFFKGEQFALSSFLDITERQQAEARLRESDARLAGVITSAMDAIITVDAEQRILLFNPAAEQMFRCSAVEAIGQPLERFIPERFRAAHRQHIEVFGQTGVTSRAMGKLGSISGRRSEGEEFPIEASISQVQVAGQTLFTVILRDITARQQAEAQIREHAARLQVLANASRAFAEASLDYQAVLDLVARQIAEALGNFCGIRLLSEDGEWLEMAAMHDVDPEALEFARTVAVQVPVRADEPNFSQRVLQSSQALIWPGVSEEQLRAVIKPEHWEKLKRVASHSRIVAPLRIRGKAIGFLIIARKPESSKFEEQDLRLAQDLADRAALAITNARLWAQVQAELAERAKAEDAIRILNTELEERVKQRTAQLEAANKELEAFSYSISHDLRAPLRAIDGFSAMLLRKAPAELSEEHRRYLNVIRNNAQQMSELISDLLTFSRLSRTPLAKQTVVMTNLVQQTLADLKAEQEGRPLEIQVSELGVCEGDPALLKQVWLNLLSNALKYTRQAEPAIVEIGRIEQAGESVYFVKDNGVGFDMQYYDKLFGVFQRLHRAEDYEGTGVGLAIVQRVIARHGGRVWAESEVNRGATFYFTLG